MSHFPRTLLAVSISSALFVPASNAESANDTSVQEMPSPDQCLVEDQPATDITQTPIQVEADKLEGINGDRASYQGNVIVTQGDKTISADSVVFHQQENIVVAEGDVTYKDRQFKTHSSKVTTNLQTQDTTLENTSYQFLCQGGRGDAALLYKSGKAFYRMEDGSLTSCPEGDNAWRLKASAIELDQEEEQATLYNTRLEVLQFPVFYVPYLTVPVGDTRKTGFLFPSVSLDTKDGLGIDIPVYWNIAPNYDLQTNFKYMERRGSQLDSKFRYLTGYGKGSMEFEYLPEDKKFPQYDNRWGGNWNHSGIINQTWKLDIDYSKVSDIDYFTDLDSEIGSREDGQLMQSGSVSYRSRSWDTTLQVRDFQVLEEDSNPYRLMPQLAMNYYAPEFLYNLNFSLLSQVSRFETDSTTDPDATRVHLEPTLELPFTAPWGKLTTEAKLLYSYYQQDLDSTILASNPDLEETVNRSLPKLRLHGELYLERETDWYDGYTQTLEPQIQYLYIPKEDQNTIYSGYDTAKLQLDYHGLFRDHRYSSVDYVAPANQVSYGATSRFYDDEYRERMNISFGQIFYVNSYYQDQVTNDDSTTSYSAWAIEADFNYDDRYFYHGGIQYDSDSDQMQLANSTLEYRYQGGFSQLNYRYVNIDYIESNAADFATDEYTRDGISQLGFISSYQLNRNWGAYGQYFYDLTEDINLEWLAKLVYTSDCWYVSLSYSNQLEEWNGDGKINDINEPEYEQNFGINFGITGFGSKAGSGTSLTQTSGSNNSLALGRPFYLNN